MGATVLSVGLYVNVASAASRMLYDLTTEFQRIHDKLDMPRCRRHVSTRKGETSMARSSVWISLLVVGATTLSACASHSISRTRTTLGEVNMEGLECRRENQPGSNIGRSYCASPEAWATYDAREKAQSKALLDRSHDEDNRRLYPGMKAD